jgi:hypothetical protein
MLPCHLSGILRPVTRLPGIMPNLSMPGSLRPLSTSPRLLAKGAHRDASQEPKIMLEDENAFGFIRHNNRPAKPRKVGVTEIRGPYYSAMGKRYLKDVLETWVGTPRS